MYGFGQIIYDKDNQRPVIIDDVWNISQYPKQHTHLLDEHGAIWTGPYQFKNRAARRETLRKAAAMIACGAIRPATRADTHCLDCGDWLVVPPRSTCKNEQHAEKAEAYHSRGLR